MVMSLVGAFGGVVDGSGTACCVLVHGVTKELTLSCLVCPGHETGVDEELVCWFSGSERRARGCGWFS